MSAFMQPPMPGYSPFPQSRQSTPFLQTPGAQGLQEGVAGGQGSTQTPSAELFGSGTEGTAPPSSIAANGTSMWNRFSGSGGAPSSMAQGPYMLSGGGMPSDIPNMNMTGRGVGPWSSVPGLVNALQGGSGAINAL